MGKGLPPKTSLEEVQVRIRESYRNPNVGKIHQVVLRDGPRAFRIATALEILDTRTGDFHHYSLKIDSINRLKSGWFHKPENSVRLDGDNPNEVESLYLFLAALSGGKLSNKTGELHIIGSDEYAKLDQFLEVLPGLASSDKVELIKAILPHIEGSSLHVEDFVAALKNSDSATVNNLAIAARVVEYRRAYSHLSALIDDGSSSEQDLQAHLQQNAWMFGSEYSELLDRRTWTRDDKLDFMLRRTVDNYLEIVEIKMLIGMQK